MADETLIKTQSLTAEESLMESPALKSILVPAEEEDTTVAAVETEKSKSIEKQSSRLPPPLSMISFREESNKVVDLRDFQKRALVDLKQLVQKALDNQELTFPSITAESSSNSANTEVSPQTIPTHESKIDEKSKEVDFEQSPVEKTELKAVAVDSEQTPVEKTEPKAERLDFEQTPVEKTERKAEEVSIWGIPLLKDERSDAILLKFLRARDFKVKETFTMLKNTIKWRKENSIDDLVTEDSSSDDLDKVVYAYGYDRDGHPVCYNVYGEFQDKELYQKMFSDHAKRSVFIRQRIKFLERSIRKLDFSPGGVSTIFQVNDLKNAPGPGSREIRVATKQALQLLQDNYPEFVAKQVFINVPWWYLAFYTMISPFMTQRTKSKLVFTGPSKSAETLLKYISPEELPVQFGGLGVDYCECNPEFTIDDPVIEVIVKPATKQTVEIIIYETCTIVWELRVVGWEIAYGAEFAPNNKEEYTVIIQKPTKISPTDNPVVHNSFKVKELGKVLLTINNPTSKKKQLLYRYKVVPLF